jgi:hypothetical protein
VPRDLLPLAQKCAVRASGPDGIQLNEKGGPGQGKGVAPLLGTELVQQPDAVALATAKDRLDLLPAETVHFSSPNYFVDRVQAFKPIRMPRHGLRSQVYTIWRSSVTSSTGFYLNLPLFMIDKGRYHSY